MKKVSIFFTILVFMMLIASPVLAHNFVISRDDAFVTSVRRTDVLYMSFEYSKGIIIEDLAVFNSKYQELSIRSVQAKTICISGRGFAVITMYLERPVQYSGTSTSERITVETRADSSISVRWN
ncbi:MAG: hypothetical protein V1652_00835 [bacterium]